MIGPFIVDGIAIWNTGQTTPRISVNNSGKYQLNVTNGTCNYEDSLTIGYTICDFWISNAFSPDNDGLNETFHPYGFEPENYQMVIFDRWGNSIVFNL